MPNAELRWLGTNSWLLVAGSDALLVDPFIEMPRAENPNGLNCFLELAREFNVRDIIISHCHFDHLSSVPEILEQWPSIVYCTESGLSGLAQDGCNLETVVPIAPDYVFDIGKIRVSVLPGKHIKFDRPLILATIDPRNMMRATQNIAPILRWLAQYREAGETVVYDLDFEGKRIQFLGSCSLAAGADYPTGADYLVLPYQGSTRLPEIAAEVIERLLPQCVIASHFDDAFPPLSSTVDLSPLRELMKKRFPQIPLTVPEPGATIQL